MKKLIFYSLLAVSTIDNLTLPVLAEAKFDSSTDNLIQGQKGFYHKKKVYHHSQPRRYIRSRNIYNNNNYERNYRYDSYSHRHDNYRHKY